MQQGVSCPHGVGRVCRCLWGRLSCTVNRLLLHSPLLSHPPTQLIPCLKDGLYGDMDHIAAVWDHAFFDRLRIDPREHPILLAEPTANTKELREATVSLMFEVCVDCGGRGTSCWGMPCIVVAHMYRAVTHPAKPNISSHPVDLCTSGIWCTSNVFGEEFCAQLLCNRQEHGHQHRLCP